MQVSRRLHHNLAESPDSAQYEDTRRLDYPAERNQEPVWILQNITSPTYQRNPWPGGAAWNAWLRATFVVTSDVAEQSDAALTRKPILRVNYLFSIDLNWDFFGKA
jgi:hypothetical protein